MQKGNFQYMMMLNSSEEYPKQENFGFDCINCRGKIEQMLESLGKALFNPLPNSRCVGVN